MSSAGVRVGGTGYSSHLSMHTASITLLERVKDARNGDAWREFFRLYCPLIAKYARLHGLRAADADEVAHNCMETLAGYMRASDCVPRRSRFCSYVRRMVNNQIADHQRRCRRSQARRGALEPPAPEVPDDAWDHVWLREHLTYCLERREPRCSAGTVRAFKLYVLKEWPVQRVCETLSLTPNQVYQAKARLTRRLRTTIAELVGEVL